MAGDGAEGTERALHDAEAELLTRAHAGDSCDLSSRAEPDRRVSAAVLYELCARDRWVVDAKGVQLKGAHIDGLLDFRFATLRVPLRLMACEFDRELTLDHATLKAFEVTPL